MSNRPFSPDAPDSPFLFLPLRNSVLFPGTTTTLAVGRPQSLAMLRQVRQGQTIIGVGVQRDPRDKDPSAEDLHGFGTYARVVGIARASDQKTLLLTLQGLSRFQLVGLTQSEPYWMVDGHPVREPVTDEYEASFLAQSLREQLSSADEAMKKLVESGPSHESPGRFADRLASGLKLSIDKSLEVLATADVVDRLRLVANLVGEQTAMDDAKRQIDQEVRKRLTKNQREHVLREHLKVIKAELGEDPAGEAADELKERLDAADLPPEIREAAERELKRLQTMNPAQAEANVSRSYLEWILDLPWNVRADVNADLEGVQTQLDADHDGLDDVKERILEHLAVMKVTETNKGSILCLVGPPGVGKTSLGQSVADATGRPFVRIALGGVRDEAEIRGHRRTYVGARPGRLIHALKKCGAKNPVVLLDEIDKLGQWMGGSPEAALLEVLDPEQNNTFTDHYMELPFDLSEVLFICTANSLQTLSGPLRDRLEIVQLSGYTHEEKARIARKHLIPQQLERLGITDDTLQIDDDGLMAMITSYTREAGVRQLKRGIERLGRALALKIAKRPGEAGVQLHVTAEDLSDLLGKKVFRESVAERTAVPGVATGLAWTAVGGDILFIETTRMSGKGNLQITGKLGDVMTESAKAALSYVRSHAEELGIAADFMEKQDLHIHVPAGGTPKDGPSAGVTIFTAITSLMTGRKVRHDTAMTGECSLRGRVLPVGGIKSKVLAAHRAGIKRIILPHTNKQDVDDIPDSVRAELEFIFAQDMSQVLEAALAPEGEVVAANEELAVDALVGVVSPALGVDPPAADDAV